MSIVSDNRVRLQKPLWLCILLVIMLYVLQGVTIGFSGVMSLYLASYGATWKQLSILSFIIYPFSVKLLWAPLIDVFYIRWLGRRRTWLLPIQIILGITFIIVSFYLEELLVQIRVTKLTVIFFFIMFLTATHDICVDGWALTLFSSSNLSWQSIAQMIGQPLGMFFGSPIVLTFESANMTNRLIRQPLGIAEQPYGLFTLSQFMRFWGVMFFIAACTILFLFREQKKNTNTSKKEDNDDHLNLLETYLYTIRLFKKKCFRQLLVFLLGAHVGFAATGAMTSVILVSMIKRETLGLITMPLILIKVTAPLLVSRTHQPLIFFARAYIPGLIVSLLLAIFILFSAHLQSYPTVFYTLLIVLLGLNNALGYLLGASSGGFFSSISDTRIGSTYYTLIASLSNTGGSVSTSLVLFTADWLPKEQAYYIEVSVCILLGCVWLCVSWKLMHRLQMLPVDRWHLLLRKRQISEGDRDDQMMTTADGRQSELPTVTINAEPSSWL